MDNLDCKVSSENLDDKAKNEEEIKCAMQNMHLSEIVDENVNNLGVNLNDSCNETVKKRYLTEKNKYKEIRKWKKIISGKFINLTTLNKLIYF